MRQRVAIAQSFDSQAKLILLDEPFGALDETTREELQTNASQVLQENLIAIQAGRTPEYTILIVTHELNEAIYVAIESSECHVIIPMAKTERPSYMIDQALSLNRIALAIIGIYRTTRRAATRRFRSQLYQGSKSLRHVLGRPEDTRSNNCRTLTGRIHDRLGLGRNLEHIAQRNSAFIECSADDACRHFLFD